MIFSQKDPIPRNVCLRRVPMKRSGINPKPRRAKPGDDPEYRNWCREQRCHICTLLQSRGITFLITIFHCLIDPAHTKRGGMALKGPDSSCVPLCRAHHDEYDASHRAFEEKYKVDMQATAAEYFARFESEKR